jgi:hypothetical protein
LNDKSLEICFDEEEESDEAVNKIRKQSKREEGRENEGLSPTNHGDLIVRFLASISLQTGRDVLQAHTSRSPPTSLLKMWQETETDEIEKIER